jgi:hypothetical protein
MAVKAKPKPMDDEAKARVDRLVAWCLEHRIATTGDGKRVLPKAFAAYAAAHEIEGGESYWNGIFGKAARPFAAKKARGIELALKMPAFYLDGGAEPPMAATLKITDLDEQEAELVMLFRELRALSKKQVLELANRLYNESGELLKEATNDK